MSVVAKHSGSLVVIGGAALIAESAAEPLPALTGADARKIVLVEPDAQRGERLRKRLEEAEREVVVVPAALAAFEGEAELSVYNLPGLRSLKPAEKALGELFPGLRLRERVPVALSPLAAVLEKAGPLPEPLTLWIDLPGSEEDVLRAWQADGALDRLDHLVLRCCKEALFAEAGTSAALKKYLEGQGFSLSTHDQSDADFPVMAFRANHGARLAAAQARQAKLQEQFDQQRKLVDEWRQKAQAFEEQNRRSEAELDAARRDLGLAMQVQASLQGDLRDLQSRFEASERVRRQQDELLRQLTPRLHEAARQLTALRLAEAPPQAPKKAVGAGGRKRAK